MEYILFGMYIYRFFLIIWPRIFFMLDSCLVISCISIFDVVCKSMMRYGMRIWCIMY